MAKLICALQLCLLYIFNTLLKKSKLDFSIPWCYNTTCNKCQVFIKEESLLKICMLSSIGLFLKIGHSANALSTAGGNVKKFNFKRVCSSSSQYNDTAAKSGFNHRSAKNEAERKCVSTAPSLSINAIPHPTDFSFWFVHTL